MRFLEWLSAGHPRQTIHVSSPVSAPLYATVNLATDNLPPGISVERGVAAVQQALAAQPGAQWVTVRPSPPGERSTVDVRSTGAAGPESRAIQAWLEGFVGAALNDLLPDSANGSSRAVPIQHGPEAAREGCLDEASAARNDAMPPVPRVKALEEDLRALSDAELLGRLLSHVSMLGGVGLAAEAMQHYSSYAALLTAPERELMGLPGFGTRLTAAVKLTYVAARRLSHPTRPFLDGTMERIAYLSQGGEDGDTPSLRILYLSRAGQLLADEPVADGHLTGTAAFPRKVTMRALELKAGSIVMIYTLLDGLVAPPEPQMRATAMIRDAAEALGLSLKVHITIENGRWPHAPDHRYRQA